MPGFELQLGVRSVFLVGLEIARIRPTLLSRIPELFRLRFSFGFSCVCIRFSLGIVSFFRLFINNAGVASG